MQGVIYIKFAPIRGGSLMTLSIGFHNLKFGWLFKKSPDELVGAFFYANFY